MLIHAYIWVVIWGFYLPDGTKYQPYCEKLYRRVIAVLAVY